MMLDDRLMTIASFVRRQSRVADIGTDHGYLPVYLTENGLCRSVIATDVKSGPLKSAKDHVKQAGLQEKITLRLGDGLSVINPDEVEDIIIAGMGGETIVSLLDATPWIKDEKLRLILQPMTRTHELHRWLMQNGFVIQPERLVIDGHHMYPVMVAVYAAASPVDDPLKWYAGCFTEQEGKPYRLMVASHLRRRAAGVENTDTEQCRLFREYADQLEKW